MPLVLNEEQRILKDSARDFLVANAPVEALRKLRDEKDELGYDSAIWQQMVELGWTAITVPEAYEGLDFGFMGLGAIATEMGHTLTASPLFATCVLGASLIELQGTEEQKNDYLPLVASGQITLAAAIEEANHHAPTAIGTTATLAGEQFILNGKKTFVLDGHSADKLIVLARTSGDHSDKQGLSLFLVDGKTSGVSIERTQMFDSRNAANITLTDVKLDKTALIGESDNAFEALDETLDRGRAILAAEMLGGCLEMFQRTCEYLKEREQFGVKIGTFQALKHRASKMFIEIELCKSAVLGALNAIDEKAENRAELVSLAKAKLNDTYTLVTNEATQMHGGIGVTDELDVGLFLKRARVLGQLLGSSSFHRDRFATIKGF
ncbi:MAG: acyl-CoA dehydrogenase [Cellvibrionales bacterium]|nr:acyl-CoA dehydrogenase [Cellvibrionales bacterium]